MTSTTGGEAPDPRNLGMGQHSRAILAIAVGMTGYAVKTTFTTHPFTYGNVLILGGFAILSFKQPIWGALFFLVSGIVVFKVVGVLPGFMGPSSSIL